MTLGMSLPEGWQWQPAVSLAKVLTSTVDKLSREDETPVRLCNYTDVYYNDALGNDRDYMLATASQAQLRNFHVEVGDVVFTKDSESADDIGIAAHIVSTAPDLVYGYHLSIYRARDARYRKFLKWVLDSSYVKNEFRARTPGVTRVGLSQNTMKYLRVATPPPDVAQAIADYLDRETAEIDAFIADQEKLIELLTERRETLHSTTMSKASWKRQIPLGALYRPSKVADRDSLPVLSVYRDYGVIRKDSRSDNFNQTPEDVSRYLLVQPGYLVVNKMKAWQGSLGVSLLEGIVSPDYEVLRPRGDLPVLPEFLHLYLRAPAMRPRFRNLSVGIRPAQWRLYWENLKNIRIPLPDLEVQSQLCKTVMSATAEVDATIADAREAVSLSKERRAALISAAVTGKIDVREHGKVHA